MKDKLKLSDPTVPLRKRYDSFLLWSNENASSIIEVIAEQLGVRPGVIDVYNEFANIEDDEFDMIDSKGIDIDSLFLILRNDRDLRIKIYNSPELFSSPQPLTAIRNFIDSATSLDFGQLVHQLSPKCLNSLAKYLKDRNIKSGTITANFRSLLVNMSKRISSETEISSNMLDWFILGITRDIELELNIFCNDEIKKKHPDDYKILAQIQSEIRASI